MKRPKTQDERDLLLYESRLQRPVRMKTPEFERNGRIRHVIFSGQFPAAVSGGAGRHRGHDPHALQEPRRAGFSDQPAAAQAGDAVFHAAVDADVSVVHGGLPDSGHHVQRGPRSDHVVGDEGRDAVRFDPHVQQLLRRDHHAEPDRPAGRVVCVFDERPGRERQPQRADRQRRLGGRRASDAGAAGYLHAAAVVSIRQPEGFAGGQPVRRAARAQGLRGSDEGPGAQDVRLLRRYRPRANGAVAGDAAGAVRGRAAGVHRAGSSEAGDARRPARAACRIAMCGSTSSNRSRSSSTASR